MFRPAFKEFQMPKLKTAMLAASLLAGIALADQGLAMAQGAPGVRAPVYDPAQLPEFKGKVAQYTLTPRGDVDGFLMTDGTEVHVPPHVSTQLVYTLRPGDAVTVHGLKARAIPMIAAMSLANDATGATINVQPPHRRGAADGREVSGRIKAVLHEPRGDVNGVLLEDGAIVRLPPPEATRLAAMLAPGQSIVARGPGYSGPLGRVVAAREIGPDASKLTEVAAPRMHEGHGRMMMDHHGHEPRPDAPPPARP
jgi:hypothetical protein